MSFSPELRTRLLTASVLVGVVVALLSASAVSCWWRMAAVTICTAVIFVCAVEYARLASGDSEGFLWKFAVSVGPAVVLCALAAARECQPQMPHSVFTAWCSTLCAGSVSVFLAAFFKGRLSLEDATAILRELPIGYWLVGAGGASLIAILLIDGGAYALLWMAAVVAANDSAAYFSGKAVGGAKLAPSLSPNKTISGSIGGSIGGCVAALLLSFLAPPSSSVFEIVLVALLVVMTAQMGDLAKSYLKRLHGRKDTGTILPGHGGVLDRLDGHLAAAPVMVCWLCFHQIL